MSKNKNIYDDDNIPAVDLPKNNKNNSTKQASKNCNKNSVDPLSESSRPRKDGPGGE